VQRDSLPPRLRLIKDKIIVLYPVLAEYLLTFLVAAKYGEAMEAVIQSIQAIKQASLPTSPAESFQLPCQKKVPHLSITNGVFSTWSQKRVYTHSRPQFSFRAMLYPSQIVRALPVRRASVPIELEDEEVDVDVLMHRKPRKDAGDISILPPAHTSYYPEVPLLLGSD